MTERITIYLSAADKKRVHRAAKRKGISVSLFCYGSTMSYTAHELFNDKPPRAAKNG